MIQFATVAGALITYAATIVKSVPRQAIAYVVCAAIPSAFAAYLYLQNSALKSDLQDQSIALSSLQRDLTQQQVNAKHVLAERDQCHVELTKTVGVIEQANADKSKIETDFSALQQRINSMSDAACLDVLEEAING